MQTRKALIAGLLAIVLCSCAGGGDATTRTYPIALAGKYVSSDGLGRIVFVDLRQDGTFLSSWHGCLGVYGESDGQWRVDAEKIVFTPRTEEGSLTGFLREATTIRHEGAFAFARDEDVDAERIDERLVFMRVAKNE